MGISRRKNRTRLDRAASHLPRNPRRTRLRSRGRYTPARNRARISRLHPAYDNMRLPPRDTVVAATMLRAQRHPLVHARRAALLRLGRCRRPLLPHSHRLFIQLKIVDLDSYTLVKPYRNLINFLIVSSKTTYLQNYLSASNRWIDCQQLADKFFLPDR